MPAQNSKDFQAVTEALGRILDPKWDGRSSFSIQEAAEILGLSPWAAYRAAKSGDLPIVRMGKREIVPRVRLERLMTGE